MGQPGPPPFEVKHPYIRPVYYAGDKIISQLFVNGKKILCFRGLVTSDMKDLCGYGFIPMRLTEVLLKPDSDYFDVCLCYFMSHQM